MTLRSRATLGFLLLKVAGGFRFSNGLINLVGVSPDHVLVDLLRTADGGTRADVLMSGGATGSGIVPALDRNITEDTPSGGWTGRFISDSDKTIHLFSEAKILRRWLSEPRHNSVAAARLNSRSCKLASVGARRSASRKPLGASITIRMMSTPNAP